MIVVDTNIIAYLYLPGPYTDAAEALYQTDPEWCAPILWRSEFRSILTGAIRRGSLSAHQARMLQEDAEQLLADHEYQVSSSAVFDHIERSTCSAYDCEFIALAETLDARLVTMDKQLLSAFPDRTAPLV